MRVVNLYGGPGSGKSTTAAGLFYTMKLAGHNVELVTEYAKDLVYGGQIETLLDQQEYIFAEQNYRQHRLRPHVDYVITDSPITLGLVYASREYPILPLFEQFVVATYGLYDNVNVLLRRGSEYKTVGRRQDEAGAHEVDRDIESLLHRHDIPYTEVQVGPKTVDEILELVMNLPK